MSFLESTIFQVFKGTQRLRQNPHPREMSKPLGKDWQITIALCKGIAQVINQEIQRRNFFSLSLERGEKKREKE